MSLDGSQRIRPTRPAPAIPQGLSRNNNRKSAPQPPRRQSAVDGESHAPITPQAAPRRSAPNLERQGSVEDNTNVRNVAVTSIKCTKAFPLFGFG